jgi:mannose-6-phosphate isomerase
MFVAITNTPRDYAWGSTTAIPELLGTEPTGRPQAELWLGTHPGSPARTATGLLSEQTTLPFLLKVLAAAAPLSLQAHPNAAQARDGFARESAAGVPLDSPQRNYKDELPKPEMLFALTPFRALCGFRAIGETRADLALLGDFGAWSERLSATGIGPTFEWLMSGAREVDELVSRVVESAARVSGQRFELVGELAASYPGDPGIALSLMLNLAVLSPGQAIFLPAGNIHAYLAGTGIELMAASDNVLRGGLTPKHVDVPELVRVLDFTPGPVPYLAPVVAPDGVEAFRAPYGNFQLARFTGDGAVPLAGDAVALCTAGSFAINGTTIDRGRSFFISQEPTLTVTGAGELFVATGFAGS